MSEINAMDKSSFLSPNSLIAPKARSLFQMAGCEPAGFVPVLLSRSQLRVSKQADDGDGEREHLFVLKDREATQAEEVNQK